MTSRSPIPGEATPTPSPPPRGIRNFNLVTAVNGGLAFCVAEGAPVLAMVLMGSALVSWLLSRSTPPVTIPRVVLNVLVLTAAANALLRVLTARQELISDLTIFLVLILCIKMFDRRTARDESQLLGLAVFVVVGAVLTNATLLTGLLLLSFTVLAIVAFVMLGLSLGQEANARRAMLAGVPLIDDIQPRRGRQLGIVCLSCVGLTLGLGIAIFLLTPRNLVPSLIRAWGDRAQAMETGFRPSIELGDAGYINENTTPVMEVRVRDGAGAPVRDAGTIYLRGAVLDRYDPARGRWDRTGMSGNDPGFQRLSVGPVDTPIPGGVERDFAPVHMLRVQEVTIRRIADKIAPLFSIYRPVAVRSETPSTFLINPRDGVLRRDGGASGPFTYTVTSRRDFVELPPNADERPSLPHRGPSAIGTGMAVRREDSPPRERYTFREGRVRDLAVRLLREHDLPTDPTMGPAGSILLDETERAAPVERDPTVVRRSARVFEDWLRTNLTYTLALPPATMGEDPIESFLFTTRRGHCEYFAAAMAAMCLSVGIEARLVTGYAAGEYNPVSGSYTVRQSDAHAWVEVQVAPGRWETFDPTPPGSLPHSQRASTGLLAFLRQLYEAIEFSWFDNVVAFDQSRFSSIDPFESRTRPFESLRQSLRSLAETIGAWLPREGVARVLGISVVVGLAAAFAIGVVLAWRKLWSLLRSWIGARTNGPDLRALAAGDERLRFYPTMLAILGKAGLSKPLQTPPLLWAETLRPHDHELAELVRALAERYYLLRFGRAPTPENHDRYVGERLAGVRARLDHLARSDHRDPQR